MAFPELVVFLLIGYGIYKLVYKFVDKKLNPKGEKNEQQSKRS